jgi:DNA-binding transcriptional regulator YiaG
MMPDELKDARDRLGLSQNELARVLGVESNRTVRRWELGERDIPGSVELAVGLLTGDITKRAALARAKEVSP